MESPSPPSRSRLIGVIESYSRSLNVAQVTAADILHAGLKTKIPTVVELFDEAEAERTGRVAACCRYSTGQRRRYRFQRHLNNLRVCL